MRTAYFDCFSGISGDMTLGALLACGADPDELTDALGGLGLPGWRLEASSVQRSGIGAVDVRVVLTEKPAHGRHLSDIERLIEAADLPERARDRSLRVFRRLAAAEAAVHQTTPERIHFHEVGAVDAIVDVVGTALLLEQLAIEQVFCAWLPMGHGFVRCEHGVIPVPAPAVVELARGFPVVGVDVEGELVTPTGAAIVTALAAGSGPMPPLSVRAVGYGAGKKAFGGRPNLLRVVIGDAVDAEATGEPDVVEVEANIDDMSPQFYEPLAERLFAAGALDVYLTPVQMKKGRPGVLVTALAARHEARALADVLFAETTTLGVRLSEKRRICLDRRRVEVATAYGPIRVKVGSRAGREVTAAPEYEDVRAAARAHGAPVRTVHEAALRAYRDAGAPAAGLPPGTRAKGA